MRGRAKTILEMLTKGGAPHFLYMFTPPELWCYVPGTETGSGAYSL
jgi:hypothetical protein